MAAEVSVYSERDVKRRTEAMCGDIVGSEDVEDLSGCTPFIINSCMLWGRSITLKEGRKVLWEGSKGVVAEEMRVGTGNKGISAL
jgi:hypothetical protein